MVRGAYQWEALNDPFNRCLVTDFFDTGVACADVDTAGVVDSVVLLARVGRSEVNIVIWV